MFSKDNLPNNKIDNINHERDNSRSSKERDKESYEGNGKYYPYFQDNQKDYKEEAVGVVNRYNYEISYSTIAGPALKTISCDAGSTWNIPNIFGGSIFNYNGRGVKTSTEYDLLQRPVSVTVNKTKSYNDPLILNNVTVQRFIYGDDPDIIPLLSKISKQDKDSNSELDNHLIQKDKKLDIKTEYEEGSVSVTNMSIPQISDTESSIDISVSDITTLQDRNLMGKVYITYDQAGKITTPSYSITGGVLESQRQFVKDYENEPDWSEDIAANDLLLQTTEYTSSSTVDALGRIVTSTDIDGNVTKPSYNPLSQVIATSVEIALPKTSKVKTTIAGIRDLKYQQENPNNDRFINKTLEGEIENYISNITYNARGQKIEEVFANNTTTSYQYDPKTFALTGITTVNTKITSKLCQTTEEPTLQNLLYLYDPMGNIIEKTDSSQVTVYYNNQEVNPITSYTYDSLYRLIRAKGRESLAIAKSNTGSNSKATSSKLNASEIKPGTCNNSSGYNPIYHINDTNALSNYSEIYTYDIGGNLIELQHTVTNNSSASYTTNMVVSGTSNRAVRQEYTTGTQGDISEQEVDNFFDSVGNQIYRSKTEKDANSKTFSWNYRNNIASYDLLSSTKEYYIYDGSGNRVRKIFERSFPNAKMITETIYLGTIDIKKRYRLILAKSDIIQNKLSAIEDMPKDPEVHIAYTSCASDSHIDVYVCADDINMNESVHMEEYHTMKVSNVSRYYWTYGKPPSITSDTVTYYNLQDNIGSNTITLDDQGLLVQREEYSPYGTTTLNVMANGSDVTPTTTSDILKVYRYSGQERDMTGLYYYGMRYYSSSIGRWMSADPAGPVDGLNLYMMVGGDPVGGKDIGGMMQRRPDQQQGLRIGRELPYNNRALGMNRAPELEDDVEEGGQNNQHRAPGQMLEQIPQQQQAQQSQSQQLFQNAQVYDPNYVLSSQSIFSQSVHFDFKNTQMTLLQPSQSQMMEEESSQFLQNSQLQPANQAQQQQQPNVELIGQQLLIQRAKMIRAQQDARPANSTIANIDTANIATISANFHVDNQVHRYNKIVISKEDQSSLLNLGAFSVPQGNLVGDNGIVRRVPHLPNAHNLHSEMIALDQFERHLQNFEQGNITINTVNVYSTFDFCQNCTKAFYNTNAQHEDLRFIHVNNVLNPNILMEIDQCNNKILNYFKL